MHKKSEVDLRVAQELKNNKEFIYQTNQALQDLNRVLIGLSEKVDKLSSGNDSDKKCLLVSFENLREDILVRVYDMNQRLGDLETNIRKFQHEFFYLKKMVTIQCASKKDLEVSTASSAENVDYICDKFDKSTDYFKESVLALREHVSNQIELIKKDLTPEPLDMSPIIQAMDDKLSPIKLDHEGLKTEIAHIKRDVSYDNKRFENVYTLIERLKKGDHVLGP